MKKFLALLLAAMLVMGISSAFAAAEDGAYFIADRSIVAQSFQDDVSAAVPYDQLNSAVGKELTRLTGIKFEWRYQSGVDGMTSMTTMLAAGEMPDLLFSYLDHSGRPEMTVLKEAASAGMFLDLTPYLENTKVLKNYLDKDWQPLDTWTGITHNPAYPDDGIYMLHMSIPRTHDNHNTIALFLNMEYANAVGIKPEEIKNTADLIAAAQKIKDAGLTDKAGQPVMPIGPSIWSGRMQSEYFFDLALSTGRESLFGVEDGKVTHISGSPLLKQEISAIREMLDKELIDPEVFTMAAARCQEGWHNGHYAFMIMGSGQAAQEYYDTGAEWLPLYHLTDKDGNEGIWSQYKSGYCVVALNADCENPQEVVDFLDFVCTREGAMLASYGVEGVHYTLNEDGNPRVTDEWVEKKAADPVGVREEGAGWLGSCYLEFRTNTDSNADFGEESVGASSIPYKVRDAEIVRDYSLTEENMFWYDGVSAAAFAAQLPEATQTKLEQFIDPSYHKDVFVKALFAADDAEVDKILAEYRELLVKQGIEEYEALLQNAYDTDPATVHFH